MDLGVCPLILLPVLPSLIKVLVAAFGHLMRSDDCANDDHQYHAKNNAWFHVLTLSVGSRGIIALLSTK